MAAPRRELFFEGFDKRCGLGQEVQEVGGQHARKGRKHKRFGGQVGLVEGDGDTGMLGTKLLVLCTYSLQKCGVVEIMDVIKNHEFALARSRGSWQLVSMPALGHRHLA